jgi:hypothetical protein
MIELIGVEVNAGTAPTTITRVLAWHYKRRFLVPAKRVQLASFFLAGPFPLRQKLEPHDHWSGTLTCPPEVQQFRPPLGIMIEVKHSHSKPLLCWVDDPLRALIPGTPHHLGSIFPSSGSPAAQPPALPATSRKIEGMKKRWYMSAHQQRPERFQVRLWHSEDQGDRVPKMWDREFTVSSAAAIKELISYFEPWRFGVAVIEDSGHMRVEPEDREVGTTDEMLVARFIERVTGIQGSASLWLIGVGVDEIDAKIAPWVERHASSPPNMART